MSTHLIIHGKVQGVGYRAWARAEAERLGLTGWVRNRKDGTVEAVVAGSPVTIASFIDQCHYGPTAARVERIVQSSFAADEIFTTMIISPTL